MPKRDLAFSRRLMNGAGSLGFTPDPRSSLDWSGFDAFVTNPISLRPRRPSASPTTVAFEGGFLLHTGLPNPGFRQVLQRHGPAWGRSPLPIIVHLMADRPEEARTMTRDLERIDSVLAVELGFAPMLADDIILLAVELCAGELPLIVSIPPDQLLRLGPRLLEHGAAALSLSPPRGSLPYADGIVSGRLLGPALFPRTLELVRSAASIGLPLISAGGIYGMAAVRAVVDAGALAAQVDAWAWLPSANEKGLVN